MQFPLLHRILERKLYQGAIVLTKRGSDVGKLGEVEHERRPRLEGEVEWQMDEVNNLLLFIAL